MNCRKTTLPLLFATMGLLCMAGLARQTLLPWIRTRLILVWEPPRTSRASHCGGLHLLPHFGRRPHRGRS